MAIADDTIVNVALPSIRADLGFTGASLAWVVDAYMLMFGGFLLLSGRTADALGRHRVFTTGTTLFAADAVLGLWGSLAGLAAVTGLLLGGVITDAVGWRWAFLVNVPVGVAVIAAVLATTTGKTSDDVAPDPTSDPATAPDRC